MITKKYSNSRLVIYSIYILIIFTQLVIITFFSSCHNLSNSQPLIEEGGKKTKKWTTIIYMAADNDLESACIQDLNEIEASEYNHDEMNVLALVDRSPFFDETNDDWSDTRLFLMENDKNGKNGTLVSRNIDCPQLDLYKDKSTELDMSNPENLKNLLNFAKKEYPAQNYSLIIWGHGTGWRSYEPKLENNIESTFLPSFTEFTEMSSSTTDSIKSINSRTRAFSIDDTSNSFMRVSELGNAISAFNLSVVVFDCCFGAIFECLYELEGKADYFVGSKSLVPENGLDYFSLLTSLASCENGLDYSKTILHEFKKSYATVNDISFTVVDLNEVAKVKNSIDELGQVLSKSMIFASGDININVRNDIFDDFTKEIPSFHHFAFPCDLYIDLYGLSLFYSTSENISVSSCAFELKNALEKATVSSWNNFGGKIQTAIHEDISVCNPSIGILFAPLSSRGVVSPSHSSEYVRGSSGLNKSRFVNESTGWVPSVDGQSESLLDVLFYRR